MKRLRLLLGALMFFVILILGGITANATEMGTSNGGKFPYVVAENSTYYESSWGVGSGRSGIVNAENPYTTIPCYARVNGYSYLDEKGRVLRAGFDPTQSDIQLPKQPIGTAKIFLHFNTTSFRNGWTEQKNISARTTVEEKTQTEIVDEISNITQTGKTAIVIDTSGSMSDNQGQVVTQLSRLEFSDETVIIVFSDSFKLLNYSDLKSGNFNIGGMTNMYPALNKAISLGVKNLIIISDLLTYESVPLTVSDNLETVTIFTPDKQHDINGHYVLKSMSEAWKKAKFSVSFIK